MGSKGSKVLLGAVAVGVVVVGAYVATQNGTKSTSSTPGAEVVERLGLSDEGKGKIAVPSDDAELAALQSGEAARNVDFEIAKAEKLLAKYEPGSGEHDLLSRRVLMLKKLKEKLGHR